MKRQIDLTGQRFGRLTALSSVAGRNTYWRCKCDCGGEALVRLGNLRRGKTKSCGCMYNKGLTCEKLEAKIERITESGCWIWTGVLSGSTGYGVTSKQYQRLSVHRVSWEMANGPIENGLFVLHRCDVRSCVNPAHLFLGTAKDNFHDAIRKGRIRGFFGRSVL